MYLKFGKNIDLLESRLQSINAPVFRDMTVICLWGVTATGKTTKALKMLQAAYPAEKPYLWGGVNGATTYAYNYVGQKRVVLDDIRGNWFKPSVLLGYLQGMPAHVNACGVGRPWLAETIICTSNEAPEHWYHKEVIGEKTHTALMRRFNRIIHVESIDQSLDGFLPTGLPESATRNPTPGVGSASPRTDMTSTRGPKRQREEDTQTSFSKRNEVGGNTSPPPVSQEMSQYCEVSLVDGGGRCWCCDGCRRAMEIMHDVTPIEWQQTRNRS